jgi:hypothetical protein
VEIMARKQDVIGVELDRVIVGYVNNVTSAFLFAGCVDISRNLGHHQVFRFGRVEALDSEKLEVWAQWNSAETHSECVLVSLKI